MMETMMIKMRKIMIMMMILALVTMRKMALEKGSTVYSNAAAPTTMTLMTLRMIMMTMMAYLLEARCLALR